MRQGAYEEASRHLEVILSVTPNDSWAQLYRSLCEQRLQSVQRFPQASAEEVESLQARLREEEQQQRRSAAEHKALERQLKKEQDQWDREQETLQKQIEREQQQNARKAKEEAVARARAEREQRRQRAQREAVDRIEAPSPAEPVPSAESPGVPRASEPADLSEPLPEPAEVPVSEGPSIDESAVELSPVTVTTPAASPGPAGRIPPPPGGVRINAQQMSVSPDRKIAVADGDVEILYENAVLTCDHLTLFTDTKDVYAEGRVRLEDGSQVFRGEMVHYNFETKKGRFLQGTVSSPPWHEYGRSVEHIAEGVFEVTPGYLTSCEFEPPHFKFYGKRAIVFADDKSARARNVALFVERVPFFYLPFIYVADRKMPFFVIPGKNKQWGPYVLTGYRYELPTPADGGSHKGTIRMDYRRNYLWGFGLDHVVDSPRLGKGLLKLYYNRKQDQTKPKEDLVKGADRDRYRLMWRHRWIPMPDTTVITDIQEFSDKDFRKDFLFREEFSSEDIPESFISSVTNTPAYTFSALMRKRINRFQTVDEALPQLTFDVRSQQIGDTWLFSESKLDFANFQTKTANSEIDKDVVRLDWFQQLKYALRLFRPVEVTPRVGVRETFYTKDIQGSTREGQRDFLSGQFSGGVDTSLKLFRLFSTTSNVLGLNLNGLRHVLTPTVSYNYIHRPTIENDLLNFSAASSATNAITFGVENKLQTRRPDSQGKLKSADLARLLLSMPYTFRGSGNKQGGRLGNFTADLETYPWPWMRLESDVVVPSHLDSRDSRITSYNFDLVLVGGGADPQAQYAPPIQGVQAPSIRTFQPGRQGGLALLPQGQWYVGLGHRYSQNDKTEEVLQVDWRLSEKWQVGTFHRLTMKEVVSGSKRFNNMREQQYILRRDLHDWIGELVYRVDREFGEELFFTLTLKAYPDMPIEMENSYHQPKAGSQSSPFSPIRVQ